MRPCLIKQNVGREREQDRGRLTSSLAWNKYSLPSCKLLGEKAQGRAKNLYLACQCFCELSILP